MRIISHRGNLYGQDSLTENSPKQIEQCIQSGFDCEIDLRSHQDCLYLGHDTFQYKIDLNWLIERSEVLWIHCKDSETLTYLKKFGTKLNYFWHETDKLTITTSGYLWCYPNTFVNHVKAVWLDLGDAVLPNTIPKIYGICGDTVR